MYIVDAVPENSGFLVTCLEFTLVTLARSDTRTGGDYFSDEGGGAGGGI